MQNEHNKSVNWIPSSWLQKVEASYSEFSFFKTLGSKTLGLCMQRAFFISPIFAAVAFTIPESYQLMHKPDSIYIPVIFELLIFGVGFIVYGVVNAIIIVPLCIGLGAFTLSRIAGFILAVAIAVFVSYFAYGAELFGHKPSILHQAYIFGIFVPIFLSAAVSFYFVANHYAKITGK